MLKLGVKFDREILRDIYDKWQKTAGDNILPRLGYLVTSIIATRIGSRTILAVYAVGMHLMNINFALGYGFQSAAVALVGRSYDAKDLQNIKFYCKKIIFLGSAFSLLLATGIILISKYYFSIFSNKKRRGLCSHSFHSFLYEIMQIIHVIFRIY